MSLITRLAITIGSIDWLPRYLPQIVKADSFIQRVSNDRLSLLDIAGLPNLTLRVPGRKSGVLRTTRLLAVPDGGTWLIAGSYFGGDVMPQWVHNVRAADEFEILVDGERRRARPSELHDEDRAAAWRVMLGVWPNFALYEERTARTIPVFRLTIVD